jgi:hypothetical protein
MIGLAVLVGYFARVVLAPLGSRVHLQLDLAKVEARPADSPRAA